MRKILLLTLLFAPFFIFSQGLNNLWLMGDGNGYGPPVGGCDINFFNGNPDTFYHPRPMNFFTTSASITDVSGNLLFYTNGVYVANRYDSLMLNGDSLNWSFYTNGQANDTDGLNIPQSHIIIPKPNDNSVFYLFHLTVDTFNYQFTFETSYLYVTTIDMTLDGNKGGVLQKNKIVLNDSINVGSLAAVKHGNGRDYWIICHGFNNNALIEFLITPDSIVGPVYQNSGSDRAGYGPSAVFSKDGSKYAIMDGNYGLDVFDFDRCTGIFSNWRHATINDGHTDGNAEFSPNGNLLYVTSIDRVYQYNLSNPILDSSQITVAVWDSTYDPLGPPLAALFRIIRLAPDNKIYISTGNSTRYLHVINNPDSVGLACDLQQHAITLPTLNFNSIPYHPNYFLGVETGSICDSLTSIHEIKPENLNLKVFPNPNNGQFSISYSLPQNKSGKLEIFDVTGKCIYKMNLPMWSTLQQISLPDISEGLYNYVITSGSMRASKKVAVIKE